VYDLRNCCVTQEEQNLTLKQSKETKYGALQTAHTYLISAKQKTNIKSDITLPFVEIFSMEKSGHAQPAQLHNMSRK